MRRAEIWNRWEAKLHLVGAARKGVLEKPLKSDLAEDASRFCAAEDVVQRLRGLRKIASGLLYFRELGAELSNRLVRGLQLLRHGSLRGARELAGRRDTGLQLLPHLAELLRN